MQQITTILLFLVAANFSRAVIFTNSASADAFVRSNAPTANYGGTGALSVSGSSATNTATGATNGIADTFIRFNTFSMTTNFNSLFGTNNWVVSGAKLQVTEVGTPNNGIFDQGKGGFEIRWVANTNWTEGTGMPNTPTTDGIVWTNEPALLTNTASLGFFTNAAANATLLFTFALPAPFIGRLQSGNDVGIFLMATDAKTGMTFNSKSFGTVTARPLLEISAAPRPGIISVNLAGTNVILSATNGANGGTYFILSSTNLAQPLNQWMPVATNVLNAGGNFSITATNAANPNSPAQQFFILQTQ